MKENIYESKCWRVYMRKSVKNGENQRPCMNFMLVCLLATGMNILPHARIFPGKFENICDKGVFYRQVCPLSNGKFLAGDYATSSSSLDSW
jgi:hypothetical protein